MLAQYLHDAAVDAEVDIDRLDFGHPFLAGDFINGLQPVRGSLIRAEKAEILFVEIELHHVTDKPAENPRRFGLDSAGCRNARAALTRVPSAAMFMLM